MKRLALGFLVVGAVFTGTVLIAPASGSNPIASSAGQKTYAKFGSVKQYRPGTFVFGAHEQITDMSWSKWGKKLARGMGTYQVNNCMPTCAEGTITPTPATVVFKGRLHCGKRFFFKRMKVVSGGRETGGKTSCRFL